MSSSQLGHTPDQDSTRSTLQSCLECLDRHNDRLNIVYKEIIEIRTLITELLAGVQSEVTVTESGTLDDSAYLRAIVGDDPKTIAPFALDELDDISPLLPLALHGQFSDQGYGPLESVGDMGSLLEDADPPFSQCSQDRDTAGFISHKLGAKSFLHQHDMYPEGQTLSGSSSTHDQRFPPPIVQISHKVKCTWPGCTRFLKKDGLTRHVNETHRRKVKAVCAVCGKKFTRPYLKRNHICLAEM
ncbi:hypothetical protein DEU56DRAFT_959513 [Suillus clintonianus]|uniref:uncharacterized protein n=1 Tax=Suillus clintonianus TaxID=1904413 RepID=UPI001B861A6B|nr:uncharacterized protein DEU56DRAFT_959513 [Suillus clintonianus]KAG2126519.1 hypothetical protein DEU56DRAFT_959513 [Suillus clintonianus]